MYGVSPGLSSSANGHSYNSNDCLDSLPPVRGDQVPSDPQAPPVREEQPEEPQEEIPSVTLTITNVVCMAHLGCHLRLKEIARSGVNVQYNPLQNVRLFVTNNGLALCAGMSLAYQALLCYYITAKH